MPNRPESKHCEYCGNRFYRNQRGKEDNTRWRSRRFCTTRCATDSRSPKKDDLPPCVRCSHSHGGKRIRGLCPSCYGPLRGTDELLDYPRMTVPGDVAWDEWVLLSRQGLTKKQVAEKLGMTYEALDRALCRYRARLKKNQEGITA